MTPPKIHNVEPTTCDNIPRYHPHYQSLTIRGTTYRLCEKHHPRQVGAHPRARVIAMTTLHLAEKGVARRRVNLRKTSSPPPMHNYHESKRGEGAKLVPSRKALHRSTSIARSKMDQGISPRASAFGKGMTPKSIVTFGSTTTRTYFHPGKNSPFP